MTAALLLALAFTADTQLVLEDDFSHIVHYHRIDGDYTYDSLYFYRFLATGELSPVASVTPEYRTIEYSTEGEWFVLRFMDGDLMRVCRTKKFSYDVLRGGFEQMPTIPWQLRGFRNVE